MGPFDSLGDGLSLLLDPDPPLPVNASVSWALTVGLPRLLCNCMFNYRDKTE